MGQKAIEEWDRAGIVPDGWSVSVDGIIKEWFAPVAITLAVIIVGYYVFKFVRNKKLGIKKVEETGVGDE